MSHVKWLYSYEFHPINKRLFKIMLKRKHFYHSSTIHDFFFGWTSVCYQLSLIQICRNKPNLIDMDVWVCKSRCSKIHSLMIFFFFCVRVRTSHIAYIILTRRKKNWSKISISLLKLPFDREEMNPEVELRWSWNCVMS